MPTHLQSVPRRNFNPLPPHGGRPKICETCGWISRFQSTPSAWRETKLQQVLSGKNCISIHSLRMEGDNRSRMIGSAATPFQSTPSAWRETVISRLLPPEVAHFNPLPPHGGRLILNIRPDTPIYFNPLPPHGGRRMSVQISLLRWTFQSTPSAWRETYSTSVSRCFSSISIHSLRMEGDTYQHENHTGKNQFQSTPSAWRETKPCKKLSNRYRISIHSLRMEGDFIFS